MTNNITYDKRDKLVAMKLFSIGTSFEEIASAFKTDYYTVKSWFEDLDLIKEDFDNFLQSPDVTKLKDTYINNYMPLNVDINSGPSFYPSTTQICYKNSQKKEYETKYKNKMAEAIEMYRSGMKMREISEKLNIGYDTVYYWMRYQIDKSNMTTKLLPHNNKKNKLINTSRKSKKEYQTKYDKTRCEAIAMFQIGITIRDISEELNIGYDTVYYWIKHKMDK